MNEVNVTATDLPQGYKNTYDKATAAIKMSNNGYAIELLLSIVKDVPAFLEGRRILRKACASVHSGKKKFIDTTGVKLRKPKDTMKKDPVAALAEIEEILKEDPLHVAANTLLFEAANAAAMPLTAAFALETALQGKPDDTKVGHKLAEFLMASDEPKRAITIYEHILKYDATDGEARKGMTNANAKLSMKQQNWEDGGSGSNFKDLLKNKEKSASMNLIGASKDQMHEQLAHVAAEYEANPNNLDAVRRIADLYERLEDWQNALSYYSWGQTLSDGDPVLESKVLKLQEKIEEIEIKQLHDELLKTPSGPEADSRRAALGELERNRAVKQVSVAKERVEKNPSDPQLRFELGSHLFLAGLNREAIPELQRAKNNPHIRHKAMLMLARCYAGGRMYDLALGTLTEASSEMAIMDNTKKEIVYEMGLMYTATEQKTEALDCFKQIYAVDYGYLDVAARVEGAYGA